jgi:cell division inhibitor SulA
MGEEPSWLLRLTPQLDICHNWLQALHWLPDATAVPPIRE